MLSTTLIDFASNKEIHMLMIGVPKTEIAALDAGGTPVRINLHPTVLRRRDGHLLYVDDDGNENRCKILDSFVVGDQVRFSAASHGAADESHVVIRPGM
jgi:hypothetical protein